MAFVTVAGEALIAYKNGHSLVLNITDFVLANISGLGAEPSDRVESMPGSGAIVHTQAVTLHGYVNANQVVYSLVMDSTVGDFDFNWVGLRADDGTLVACAHIPSQHKAANSGGTPGNNLTRNFLLAFAGIATTTAIAVPAATWQIDFTTRLLQVDERERLSNFDVYGHAGFFGNAFLVSYVSAGNYKITAGVAYVGGIRCEILTDAALAVSGLPKSVWLDASLQGDINGVSAVLVYTATASALTDYTDSFGFKHFVTKLADINVSGVVTDRRRTVRADSGLVRLFGDLTVYVSTAGSDSSGDGSAALPWATGQHAVDTLYQTLDFNGYTVRLRLLDGTHTQGINLYFLFVGQKSKENFFISGNASSPTAVSLAVVANSCISVSGVARVTVENLQLQTTVSGDCLNLSDGSTVEIKAGVQFDGCAGSHISISNMAKVFATDVYTIAGDGVNHLTVSLNSVFRMEHLHVVTANTPHFSDVFFNVSLCGVARVIDVAYPGTGCTGKKFHVYENGVINTGGGGTGYLPGNIDGTYETGGIYD